MSGFELLNIFVNDNFQDFMELDKDEIDFREPLKVSSNILPPILKDNSSATAVCIFKGAEKCLSWIVSNTDISELYDFSERSLFDFAAASSNPNIYTILENSCPDENQNHEDSNGMLPIHYATMFGNIQVLKYLWMNGSDLDVVTKDSHSLLDLAVLNWQPEIVEFLLNNLELNEKHFQSIFYLASRSMGQSVYYGNTSEKAKKILDYFIKAGLDVLTITNLQNKKLLFFYLEREDKDMLKYLFEKIGDTEIKNEEGLTPYEFAKRYKAKDMIDFVLDHSKHI